MYLIKRPPSFVEIFKKKFPKFLSSLIMIFFSVQGMTKPN